MSALDFLHIYTISFTHYFNHIYLEIREREYMCNLI